MTRTYALHRLLDHGPLTWRELREITGWSIGIFESAMYRALNSKLIERRAEPGTAHFVYAVA